MLLKNTIVGSVFLRTPIYYIYKATLPYLFKKIMENTVHPSKGT